MKIYLVGGVVRDTLLHRAFRERDWVVVGAKEADLTSKGFKKVGKDFPVFIHPKTKEEYALARTERKTGRGYYGFSCDFGPEVTLEDDLLRRDLTINAMAMDDKGQIIDPFGGQSDIENKILRHVSDAFVEDPVRVLRIARFAARFAHLGFVIHSDTRCLMYEMVRRGELDALVPERIWKEWSLALAEPDPGVFITSLRDCGALMRVIPEMDRLFGVPNTGKYHPEVDTGVHSLMILDAMVKKTEDPVLRFAALTHDLGKGCTAFRDWPSHPDHEEKGAILIDAMSKRLAIPNAYRDLARAAARFHTLIHKVFELSPKEQLDTLYAIGAFRDTPFFLDVLKVCEADGFLFPYPQAAYWQELFQTCAAIRAEHMMAQGHRGKAISDALYEARLQKLGDNLSI